MDGRVGVYMRDDTMITCTVLLSYLIPNNIVHYLTYHTLQPVTHFN